MNSDKPHIKKVSQYTWMCFDEECTGIGSSIASCWLDYFLKTNY